MLLEKVKKFFTRPQAIKAIIFIAFYFIMMFVVAEYVITPLFKNTAERIYDLPFDDIPEAKVYMLSSIFDVILYIFLIIPLLIGYSFELQYDFFHTVSDKRYGKFLLISLGVFYVGSIMASMLANVIYHDSTSANQESIESTLNAGRVAAICMFTAAVIIGPIVEELIFRQAMFDLLINKYVATIVSSFIFALIHVVSSTGSFRFMVSITLPYFVSGLLFATIYEKSHRNIWLSIGVHAISNCISLIIALSA